MTARIELGLFDTFSDAECWRCEQVFEINAFAVFTAGDQWTCPSCADREFEGIGQIVKGLDAVFEATMLDVFTRPIIRAEADTITWALRKMAGLIDDVMDDKVKVGLVVKVVEGIVPSEEGQPIGISIDRRMTRIDQEPVT